MWIKFFLLTIAFIFFSSKAIFAIQMESPNYRLDLENVQSESSTPESIQANNPTISSDLFNIFQQQGYVVLEQETDTDKEITFNLTKTAISFDTSKPNIIDEATVMVSAAIPFGYEINIVKKQDIVHSATQDSIPQTYCDNNNDPCTPRLAKPWTQEVSYGIGYNVQGHDISSNFKNSNYFRPFPQQETISFMKNLYVNYSREANIRLKLNANPTQAEGTYEGIYEIRFIPQI